MYHVIKHSTTQPYKHTPVREKSRQCIEGTGKKWCSNVTDRISMEMRKTGFFLQHILAQKEPEIIKCSREPKSVKSESAGVWCVLALFMRALPVVYTCELFKRKQKRSDPIKVAWNSLWHIIIDVDWLFTYPFTIYCLLNIRPFFVVAFVCCCSCRRICLLFHFFWG